MTLSLCIVGCGGHAKTVLDAVHDMRGEFDFYFASRDEARAREYCAAFGGAGYFGSYEDAAPDPRVEAMYFLTPHDAHVDNARLAAAHSKHILIEKPIARNLEEAGEMVRAAEASGVKFMVAENFRFLPAVARIKQLMGEGGLGKLRLIQVHVGQYRRTTGWATLLDRAGGGEFLNGGIHSVDILVNVGGLPESVFALETPKVHPSMEGEDGMVMMARFGGGGVGLIGYLTGTADRVWRQHVTVTCEKGEASFRDAGNELTIATPAGTISEELGVGWHGAVRDMLREFRDCISEDREPVMSGHEGMKDLAVVQAARTSAATGKQVSPDSS